MNKSINKIKSYCLSIPLINNFISIGQLQCVGGFSC